MEFIQIAYCSTAPFLLVMAMWGKKYRFFYRNLLSVSLFLLITHSVFVMRQLNALYQVGKQLQLQQPFGYSFADGTMMRLMLEILLPFLVLLPGFRKSIVFGGILLLLLWMNHPLHTWNLYGLFNKIPAYISLVSATYGLFWLLNLLPYQTRNQ